MRTHLLSTRSCDIVTFDTGRHLSFSTTLTWTLDGVTGDTHGQLEDVLTIFLAHGTPSSRNRRMGPEKKTERQHQASTKEAMEAKA